MSDMTVREEKQLRSRARREGIDALGDGELMQLVLGTGVPSGARVAALLEQSGGLGSATREGDLDGLSEARRLRLEAALELGRRSTVRQSLRPEHAMSSPERVGAWGQRRLGTLGHEELWMLALDGRHGLLATRRLSQGGAHGCAVGVRDVLRLALRLGAAAFILVHNHPSGDPTPSPEDAHMTREVARAAELVGVPLLDHIVIGAERHASLFALGLLSAPG